MSYLHVDAINQQFPADVSPEAMLVATKFAELLAKDDQMTRRVSRNRLETITHISERRLAKYLIELHERNLLVMTELPKSKKIGDRPIEYRLCLPEGLDKKVIDMRRGRYYAGKSYISKYNENFVEITAVGDRISDISAKSVMRHRSAKIADSSAKFANQSAKIADQSAEIAPINIENKASPLKENNNNNAVVVDVEVEKFLEEAVKVTGGAKVALADLVKSAEEARIGLDTVRYFQVQVVDKGREVENPVGYLRKLVGSAIAAGGLEALLGEIRRPKVESESEKVIQALAAVLGKYLARPEFALLSKEEKTEFARTAQSRFFHRDGNEYLQVCLDDFLYDTKGHNFASAAELLKALDDYTEKFLSKRQLHA